jgi:hypothetical protein
MVRQIFVFPQKINQIIAAIGAYFVKLLSLKIKQIAEKQIINSFAKISTFGPKK